MAVIPTPRRHVRAAPALEKCSGFGLGSASMQTSTFAIWWQVGVFLVAWCTPNFSALSRSLDVLDALQLHSPNWSMPSPLFEFFPVTHCILDFLSPSSCSTPSHSMLSTPLDTVPDTVNACFPECSASCSYSVTLTSQCHHSGSATSLLLDFGFIYTPTPLSFQSCPYFSVFRWMEDRSAKLSSVERTYVVGDSRSDIESV